MVFSIIFVTHLLLAVATCSNIKKNEKHFEEAKSTPTSTDRFYPDENPPSRDGCCKVPYPRKQPRSLDCRKGLNVTVNDKNYYVIKNADNFRRGQLCWVKEAVTGTMRLVKIMDKHGFWSEITTEHQFNLMLKDSNHIPKLIDWEERPHVFLSVMEYTKNTMRGYPWSPQYIRTFWKKMLIAAKAIHESGVLILGINRQNLLEEEDNVVKFLDFGLSVELGELRKSSFAKQQFALATTAPEVFSKQRLDEVGTTASICKHHNDLKLPVLEGEIFKVKAFEEFSEDCDYTAQVGPTSDLWSICCVVYEMMYGDSPFEHLVRRLHAWYSILQRMVEHLLLAIIIDHSQELYFPPYQDVQLRDMIKQCLVREPNFRPSVLDFIKMLNEGGKADEL